MLTQLNQGFLLARLHVESPASAAGLSVKRVMEQAQNSFYYTKRYLR